MISPESTILETFQLLVREKLHRTYVVSPQGTLHGVISIIDLLEFLSMHGL